MHTYTRSGFGVEGSDVQFVPVIPLSNSTKLLDQLDEGGGNDAVALGVGIGVGVGVGLLVLLPIAIALALLLRRRARQESR